MTYTPVAIPLPNPTDKAYTTVIEGRTYIVGGFFGDVGRCSGVTPERLPGAVRAREDAG